jgi:predicted nucleic acid-binding protein
LNVYAESSAVLSWLMDEQAATSVRTVLANAEIVVASDLTLIECDRVVLRALHLGELSEVEAADRRAHLTVAASHWQVLRIGAEVVARSREPFPGDTIRTLDAIHLACALVARSAIAGLQLLSLDKRTRNAGEKIGFGVLPENLR